MKERFQEFYRFVEHKPIQVQNSCRLCKCFSLSHTHYHRFYFTWDKIVEMLSKTTNILKHTNTNITFIETFQQIVTLYKTYSSIRFYQFLLVVVV